MLSFWSLEGYDDGTMRVNQIEMSECSLVHILLKCYLFGPWKDMMKTLSTCQPS